MSTPMSSVAKLAALGFLLASSVSLTASAELERTIDSARIRLADISDGYDDGELASLDLGPAPPPGNSRLLSRGEVEDQLHAAGDDALRQVAAVLAAAVRPRDSLARYGGEEFAVLVPDVEGEQAVQVAERLREAVASRRMPGADRATLTISVGVGVKQPADTLASLLARADAALYRAKADGRNRTCT